MLLLLLTLICLGLGVKIRDLLEGKLFFRDWLYLWWLQHQRLHTLDQRTCTQTHQSDIIVCLTTIPSRISHLELTIKSLLNQTMAPSEIRIHVPDRSLREACGYEIPAFLNTLSRVRLISCPIDYGPATKLIPALALTPDQKLLIVDDDQIYPQDLLAHFRTLSDAHPDIALCSSGWIVPDDLTDIPTPIFRGIFQLPPVPVKGTRIRRKREIDIMQGYAGYLVKPRFFDRACVTDYSAAPSAAFYVDDVWISAHCNASKWVFPAPRFCTDNATFYRQFKSTSLGLINRGAEGPQTRNNTIMIRFFKHKWLCH